MTETDGIVERPTDVIGQLEYEIDRGGNSATINAMIAARDALLAQQNGNTPPPVTAWAVVDKDGMIDIKSITYYSERAERTLVQLDRLFKELAPFRVIEVTITPKEKG